MRLCRSAPLNVLEESTSGDVPQRSNVQVGGGKSMRRLLICPTVNGISPLANVAAELLTDPDESAIDVAGSLTHASCGGQCDKRDNQQVLD